MTATKRIFDAPFLISATLFFGVTFILLAISVAQNGGNFNYVLDDAYIHLAIAKNVALHQNWGVQPHEFSSASSSPWWILVVSALFVLFGVQVWMPFALNVVLGVALLYLCNRFLQHFQLPAVGRTLALVLMIAIMPLPALVFTGMEHIAHTLFLVMFCTFCLQFWQEEKISLWKWGLVVINLALIRYESIFWIGITGLFFLQRTTWKYALGTWILAALPLLLFGAYNVLHGWFWLPAPMIMKPFFYAPPFSAIIWFPTYFIRFVGVGIVGLWLLKSYIKLAVSHERSQVLPVSLTRFWFIFSGTVLAQFVLAQVNWFYRYEAYLIVMGVLLGAITAFWVQSTVRHEANWRVRISFASLICAILLCLSWILIFKKRTFGSMEDVVLGMGDRNAEHISMARFVQDHYNGQTVVINDIGTTNYFTAAKTKDILGLSSIEPVRFSLNGKYGRQEVFSWIAQTDARVAILQSDTNEAKRLTPPQWIKVGEWKLSRNIIFLDYTVSFYAIRSAEIANLKQALIQFKSKLPAGVTLKLVE